MLLVFLFRFLYATSIIQYIGQHAISTRGVLIMYATGHGSEIKMFWGLFLACM